MKRFGLIVFVALLGIPSLALAQVGGLTPDYPGNTTGVPVPYNSLFILGPAGQLTATTLILSIIQIALWIVGLISVLFVIIGGFRYVTAAGDSTQAEGAKGTIKHAIIGLIIVILSFVIIRVIANALVRGSLGV